MNRKGKTNFDRSVDADTLLDLRTRLARRGMKSEMLDARLAYIEEAQVLSHYLSHVYWPETAEPGPTYDQPERVYPHMLPTQANGRWSVTHPPIINFPSDIRDVVQPDPGWPWLTWDWDALYARFCAAYTHDTDDLEAFKHGYDVHTITACRMTKLELPPDLKDPHTSPACAAWREKHGWKGKDDKRRVLAKVRYALIFGKDWTAVRGSKYERDMVKMGFPVSDMEKAAKLFLQSKPNLVSTRMKYFEELAKKGEARTIFGRRRKLFGDWGTRAKEGWNHLFQGLEADLLGMTLIALCSPPSKWRLVYPVHDGAKIAVPESHLNLANTYNEGTDNYSPRAETLARFKQAVIHKLEIEREQITCDATMGIVWADGRKEKI